MPTLPIARRFNFAKFLLAVSFISILSACGGGGAKAPSTGQPTSGGVGAIPGVDPGATSDASSVQLLVSSQTLASSGTETVTLTGVVLNANGRALSDKALTLIVDDPVTGNKVFVTKDAGKTNADGVLTAILNLGANKANRTISIRAKSDLAIASNTVDVVGTTVTISGTTSLVLNQSSPLTITLKDAGGKPIQGAPITLTSRSGNTLTDLSGNPLSAASPPVTNRSGQVIVQVKSTASGSDEVTASTLGASSVANLVVSGSNFSFVSASPPADTDVLVNTAQSIRVRWIEGGVPQNGRTILFSATRGTISTSSVVTDAAGEAAVTIQSNAAGATTVQASASTGTPSTTLNFVFVTTSATLVNVKADKTTVPVNAAGTTTNRSTITAVVRDGANNLVKNARVQFEIVTDTTGGTLSGTEDISDVAGEATVDYIAGTTTSSNEGVTIRAKVIDVNGNTSAVPVSGLTNSLKLTVAGQSLFIRLQTDNLVTPDSPRYKKTYTALVTDSAGNPVPNARVQFEIRPAQPPLTAYFKGYYRATTTRWTQVPMANCYNEDLNLNGVIDNLVSEDTNYNGLLDAGEDRDSNGKLNGVAPYGVDIGNLGSPELASEDDIIVNGLFDTNISWNEDLNGNGLLNDGVLRDKVTNPLLNEDANGNGVLDPGEDLNQNGKLDLALSEDINVNGLLDSAVPRSEDRNGNGVFDPKEFLHTNGGTYKDKDEDFNQDGSLTPGNVVTVDTNVVTSPLGFADATIAYAKNFANWIRVTLTAKITVQGSETTSSVTFVPLGLASDYTDVAVIPPGQLSPFGVRRNCKSSQ